MLVEYAIMVILAGGKIQADDLSLENPALNQSDYHLQWEFPKERWLKIKDQGLPWSHSVDKVRPIKNVQEQGINKSS